MRKIKDNCNHLLGNVYVENPKHLFSLYIECIIYRCKDSVYGDYKKVNYV